VRAIVPRCPGCVKPKIGGEGLSEIERDVELPHRLLGFASGVVKKVAVRLIGRPGRLLASARGCDSGGGRRGAGGESGGSDRSGRSARVGLLAGGAGSGSGRWAEHGARNTVYGFRFSVPAVSGRWKLAAGGW